MRLHQRRVSRTARRGCALGTIAVLGALTIAITACAPGGDDSQPDESGTADAAGIEIAIMGGAASDAFWSTVKRGAEDAAKVVEAAGGTVTFVSMPNYDNFNADAAKLVANIQALAPDAAIIPDWAPDAQNNNITALTASGTPVFIYNTGIDQVDEVGALGYIGANDFDAGKLAGETFVDNGAVHVVCVNTLPGTTNADIRCDGLQETTEAGGAAFTALNLPSSSYGNPTAVAQAIKGALLEDPTIDGVFTLGQADTTSGASGIDQAGRTGDVLLGGMVFDSEGLERIQAGTQLFALDQQPYQQGYYAVAAAFQYAAYGLVLAQNPFLTGPAVIDASNVESAITGAELGVR